MKPEFQKAFTLIELLVVISILGLLSSVVLLSMEGATDQAEQKKAMEFSHVVRVSLGADLTAEYRLNDGTATDSSGNGYNGTLVGNTVSDDGIFGSALRFDGDGDYVDITIPNIQATFDKEGTMECWFKIKDINNPSNRQLLMRIGSGDALMLYTEKYDGTKRGVKHTWYNGADWGDISAKGDLKNNNWYYVTYTWNSTKQTLYLNGEQINQRNKPSLLS